MTLIDFTLSNATRFYSSMGNTLAVKGLKRGVRNSLNLLQFYEFAELYPLLHYVNKTPLKIIIVQKRSSGITSDYVVCLLRQLTNKMTGLTEG